jgi:ribosomal protein L23
MKTLRPYITEKTVTLVKSNKYTLIVDYNATKKEIESEIKKYYKVRPLSINSLKTKYLVAAKRRQASIDRGFKKIIVELAKDQKIPGFDFETKEEATEDKKRKKPIKEKIEKVENDKKS